MHQLTLRIDEELAENLRREAKRRNLSVNAFAANTLAAAVDPETASSSIERTRERLRKAGILSEPKPSKPIKRPSPERLAAARKAAGKGKSLSDIIIEDRG